MKKISVLVIVIISLCTHLKADPIEPFYPSRTLKSDFSLEHYHSGNYSRADDKRWLVGLQKSISAQYDGAVILDVGYGLRPYPELRSQGGQGFGTIWPDGLGHGVIVLAMKKNKFYIYGSDLTLMSPRLGIDAQLFLKSIETAKKDATVRGLGDDPFIFELAKSAAVGAAVFGGLLLYTTDPSYREASVVGLTVTGATATSAFVLSKLDEFMDGKQRVLGKAQKALLALTNVSETDERKSTFFRHSVSDVGAFEDILRHVIIRSMNPSSCEKFYGI